MATDRIHVVPHGDGWGIKWEGKNDVESTYPTQKEAIDAARALAQRHESDHVVVHRADGTFRKVYSVGGEEEDMSERNNNAADGRTRSRRIDPEDVISVGSRISWSAVLAGVAIALTLFLALIVLGTAAGITLRDRMGERAYFTTAMIWFTFAGLVSLFVGGFVVSRLTAGEDKTEALAYGVVLWGAFTVSMAMLGSIGVNVGYSALAARNEVRAALPEGVFEGVPPEHVDRMKERIDRAKPEINPTAAAWWGFAGLVLSIGAAIGGSLAGAGPNLVLRQLRERRAGAGTTAPTTTAQTHLQTSNR